MHPKKHLRKNSPTSLKLSVLTRWQQVQFAFYLTLGLGLTAIFGAWWFEPSHIPQNFTDGRHIFDYLLFFILTYIVWHHIMMEVFSWYISVYAKHPAATPPPENGLRVAYLTAFVPGAEPYSVLEDTMKAMSSIDYPHDTWLLDEGNDDEAKRICARYGVKHYSRNGKAHFNTDGGKFAKKTKGGNYNSWLEHYSDHYDIVAQHDMDFIPAKDFLTRTLGYFRDPQVAFVGTPQVYGNLDESWIARGAAEQTYGFYGPLQKGFYGHDMTLLIGANHIMRMSAYRDLEGYTAHITEDLLTGMKLYTHKNNWKSVYVPEALLIGEGPTTWASYFAQQMRWAYGCMDIFFRHSPTLLPKMRTRHIANYAILQQFYFSGVAQVAGVFLLTLYFLFGITSANMTLLPILVLYLPLVIYQIFLSVWLQRINIEPKSEHGLLLRGRLLSLAVWPIFFLAFVGAVRGKRLTYVVTPKGNQDVEYTPSLFVPHLVLGSITLLDIIVGFALGNAAPVILFWALLNTLIMYYFFFSEATHFVLAKYGFSFEALRKNITPPHTTS